MTGMSFTVRDICLRRRWHISRQQVSEHSLTLLVVTRTILTRYLAVNPAKNQAIPDMKRLNWHSSSSIKSPEKGAMLLSRNSSWTNAVNSLTTMTAKQQSEERTPPNFGQEHMSITSHTSRSASRTKRWATPFGQCTFTPAWLMWQPSLVMKGC
ncbi:hypothetical protein ES708_29703 [subsurface metagenome]